MAVAIGVCQQLRIVPWIEKIVGILNLCVGLLVKQLVNCVGDRLRHKLQSMLALYFVSIVEPSTLVEIPIDLLNFWHFPAVVLLGEGSAIVLSASLDLGLPAHSDLVGGIVDFLPQSLFSLLIMIFLFKAVEFFPSFGLRSGLGNGLVLVEHAISFISCYQIREENAFIWTHVLCFIEHFIVFYGRLIIMKRTFGSLWYRGVGEYVFHYFDYY